MQSRLICLLGLSIILVLLNRTTAVADPIGFSITDLASNQPGVAITTDPDLRNPWGIAISPLNPVLWIADNASGLSELYTMTGVKVQQLVVTMPTNILGENSPVTGMTFHDR